MTQGTLRLGFQVWGQYVTWDELMRIGHEIDELGFEELWANDHFVPPVPGPDGEIGQLDGPVFEGWSTLFGWAAVTRRARMGVLVSGAGYRNPALMVKMATALDHATGGRAVLGLGAGWLEREHRAFGFEFPPLGKRIDRFTEAAAICRLLLHGTTVHVAGDWYAMEGARNDPPPVQQPLPLAIGGSGEKRTLRIVAANADIWNADGDDPASFLRRSEILDGHCRTVGRDPASIERTAGLPPPCIRASRDEAVAALTATLEQQHIPRGIAQEMAARSPFAGTVESVAAKLREYRDVGLAAAMFDWPAPFDRQTLEALAGPVREAIDR